MQMEGDSSEDLLLDFVPANTLCTIFRFILRRNLSSCL